MTMQQKLEKHIAENSVNISAVARSMGMTNSTRLSLWLRGEYDGDNAKISAAVKSFLEKESERISTPSGRLNFVMTGAARKIYDAARACHIESEIGVAYGDAGLGKTWAVKKYAAENPDVILIETTPGFTAKYLFFELTRALGIETSVNLNEMFNDAYSKLKESGRMIIIDEAENLPYRALELIRRLHDKSETGILLVGMPVLIGNLRGKKGEFKQLYSRVGIAVEVKTITLRDTEAIINEMIPGSNGIYKDFYRAAGGNLRRLGKLYKRSVKIASLNDCQVNSDIVIESEKLLIGG